MRSLSKLVKVPLPDLGEGTKEATIKEWYVKPGSNVEEVSPLSFVDLWLFFSLTIWWKSLLTNLWPRFPQHAKGLSKK